MFMKASENFMFWLWKIYIDSLQFEFYNLQRNIFP